MVGYCPVPENQNLNDGMNEVNDLLKHYRVWHSLLDASIVIGVEDCSII